MEVVPGTSDDGSGTVRPDAPAPAPGGHRAALAGLVFSGLYVAAFAILGAAPDASASLDELEEYHGAHGNGWMIFAGLYLVPFAGLAFLWFTAAFRHRLASLAPAEDALLATIQLLSGAVYVAMVFAATAVVAAPAIALRTDAMVPADLATTRPLAVA